MSQLSTSIVELRNKIEREATRTRKNPGEVLLSIIRLYSSKLNDQLIKLRERSAEVVMRYSTIFLKKYDALPKYF